MGSLVINQDTWHAKSKVQARFAKLSYKAIPCCIAWTNDERQNPLNRAKDQPTQKLSKISFRLNIQTFKRNCRLVAFVETQTSESRKMYRPQSQPPDLRLAFFVDAFFFASSLFSFSIFALNL